MTKDERSEKLIELHADLLRLRTMVKAGGSIENPSDIKNTKKTIARILTVENEEKLEKNMEFR
jgi:large subunit ribosomal protein L29